MRLSSDIVDPDAVTQAFNGVLYPDVAVQLSGLDGNAWAIIARVEAAIREVRGPNCAAAWYASATACESYDALLRLAMTTVTVS